MFALSSHHASWVECRWLHVACSDTLLPRLSTVGLYWDHVCVQDAFNSGDRETLLYVPAIIPDSSRPDYLAVIDVDSQSDTYQQVCCSFRCAQLRGTEWRIMKTLIMRHSYHSAGHPQDAHAKQGR
jgi:56kDa selenium binding protein (SBP56)